MDMKTKFKWKSYEALTDADIKTKPEQVSEDILKAMDETDEALQTL